MLPRVNRGDLITADLINAMIDEIEELKQQLGNTGSAPVISLITPSTNLHVGDALDIRGENFRFTQGAQLVTFDGILVTAYKPGTSDVRLLIDIPNVPNIPEGGKNVELIIANGLGSTSRQLMIRRVEIPLEGDIVDVFWDSVTPNPIAPSVPATINYRVRSRAGQTATFILTPTILTPGWPQNLEVLIDGVVSNSRQIQVAPMQERAFSVRIPVVPPPMANTSFTIRTVATVGTAVGSDTRTFTVGQVVVPPDNTITVSPQSFTAFTPEGFPDPGSGNYNDATGTINVRAGASGLMELLVEFTQAGTYQYTIDNVGTAPAGWAIALSETSPTTVIEASDFSGGVTKVSRLAKFSLDPAANGASANGEILFRVARQGSQSSQTRNFRLALLP